MKYLLPLLLCFCIACPAEAKFHIPNPFKWIKKAIINIEIYILEGNSPGSYYVVDALVEERDNAKQ